MRVYSVSAHAEIVKIGDFLVPKSSIFYARLKAKGLIRERVRIPVGAREKAAYIKLREKGYTINTIAGAFGRSTSLVHRTLKRAYWILYSRRLKDLRKIPKLVREAHARLSFRSLRKYLPLWEAWILSEEGDPP